MTTVGRNQLPGNTVDRRPAYCAHKCRRSHFRAGHTDHCSKFVVTFSGEPSYASERRQIKSPHHLTLIDRSDIGNLHAHVARRMRSFYLDTLSAGVITRIIFRAMRQIHLATANLPQHIYAGSIISLVEKA